MKMAEMSALEGSGKMCESNKKAVYSLQHLGIKKYVKRFGFKNRKTPCTQKVLKSGDDVLCRANFVTLVLPREQRLRI